MDEQQRLLMEQEMERRKMAEEAAAAEQRRRLWEAEMAARLQMEQQAKAKGYPSVEYMHANEKANEMAAMNMAAQQAGYKNFPAQKAAVEKADANFTEYEKANAAGNELAAKQQLAREHGFKNWKQDPYQNYKGNNFLADPYGLGGSDADIADEAVKKAKKK